MAAQALKTLWLLHGVNLDMLGRRDPAVYGTMTLTELESYVARHGERYGFTVYSFQTNFEGELVEKMHQLVVDAADAAIVNPGAWTHYSYALHDALELVAAPVAEVHLSDVESREEWRRVSVIADVVDVRVSGKGRRRLRRCARGAGGARRGRDAPVTRPSRPLPCAVRAAPRGRRPRHRPGGRRATSPGSAATTPRSSWDPPRLCSAPTRATGSRSTRRSRTSSSARSPRRPLLAHSAAEAARLLGAGATLGYQGGQLSHASYRRLRRCLRRRPARRRAERDAPARRQGRGGDGGDAACRRGDRRGARPRRGPRPRRPQRARRRLGPAGRVPPPGGGAARPSRPSSPPATTARRRTRSRASGSSAPASWW